jgi:hypothetical protein
VIPVFLCWCCVCFVQPTEEKPNDRSTNLAEEKEEDEIRRITKRMNNEVHGGSRVRFWSSPLNPDPHYALA